MKTPARLVKSGTFCVSRWITAESHLLLQEFIVVVSAVIVRNGLNVGGRGGDGGQGGGASNMEFSQNSA